MSSPVCVIPARFASTRFPGKPLALIAGKPMIEHVYRACTESGAFSRVLIATDDQRIADAAIKFGARVQLTSPDCASGTDRVAQVARVFRGDVFINVQGDEPLIDPAALKLLASAFDEPAVNLATLVRPLDEAERANPNVVKAVLALNGDALYFSRHDVPFERAPAHKRWAHVGLYGYRRDTLLQLSRLPVSPLEDAEKLEQLRALENGIRIRCLVTSYRSVGVDTPEDLATAERLLERR
ncbi:MAG: 3-deoxy-manno-octulosonate cytidylyltransferase [Myxococcaceae bacterium]